MAQNESTTLRECFSQAEIEARVTRLAADLTARFASNAPSETIIAICVLRGACMFFSDLVRRLHLPQLRLDFIGLSSYQEQASSSGSVQVTHWLSFDVRGRDVLIVEDIVDTGQSMRSLLDRLAALEPRSITLCALLDKKERRVCEVQVDYACFQVDQGFFVGYGLDYAQKYRNLPYIGVIES